MMPGENQSKALAIAADATTGNCQNCSVLQQSLGEYVSSFLALKQKIAVSDDTIRLQQQLEELQIRLVTLEKKTADYESVQAELEEKKSALKVHEQLSEEVEKLKVEKSKTIAVNKKLEDQLKNVKDLADKQTLENAQLKREKAVVENDLLISQTSLQKSQAQAEQAEKLMDENAKMTSTKDSLESKIRVLEDSVCQQKHQISQLTKEKTMLERNINDLQVRLMKLERERNKDYRSTTTQASAPAEPKIDKEKFRMLLENLWACVDPEQEESVNQLHFPESRVPPSSPQATLHSHLWKMSPSGSPKISEPHSFHRPAKATCAQLKQSLCAQNAIQHKASRQCSGERKQAGTPKKSKRSPKARKAAESSTEMDTVSLEEIIRLFKPMPPRISPLPDLDTEVESMKMDDGENETHPKPCEDCPALKQERTLVIATSPSSQSPKSAALQTEGNADFSVVTIEGGGEIFNETDFEQTKFGGIPKIIDKIATDIRGLHPQHDMLIEREPSSVQLSPPSSLFSTSSFTGLIEAVSLPTESTLLSCNPGISRLSENENALEDANDDPSETVTDKEDEPETITSMDVDVSPSDSPDGGESALISDSLEGIVVAATQNSSDIEKNSQDTFKLQDSTRSGCKDSDIPEHTPSSSVSSASITAVSNKHLEEKVEVDESIKLLGKEDGNAQGTGEDDVAAFPASSTCNNIPSPPTSPLLKSEDDQSGADQESGQANVEPFIKKDTDIDTVTNFQETNTVNCESLKESAHSLCRRMSPSCLLPSINLQALESHPGKMNGSVNIDHVSTNKVSPFPNLEEECDIEKATAEDLPQDKICTGSTTSLETMPDSPDTNTVNCEASKEDGHSLCRRLSPSCLLPTLKLVSLDSQLNPGLLDTDVQTEVFSTKIQMPSFSLEEQGVTKSATNEDQTQDEINGGNTTPLIQNPAATEEQDKSLDFQTVAPENLIGEEKTTSGGSSTEVQTTECISNVRGEMGPPLPRLLTPLKTPPKANRSINPRQAIGKLLFPSPMDGIESPTSPTQTNRTPNHHQLSSLSTNSPLPLNGVPSSPLQFGSATPKHAVPVPGRLPLTAMSSSPSSSSTTPSQENSMRILDTMYPELSARARTLSILRGNVNLNICSSESGTLPTSFKTINSTSTAFTKTEVRGEKRPAIGMPQPKSSKCFRLESSSADATRNQVLSSSSKSGDDASSAQYPTVEQLKTERNSSPLKSVEHPQNNLIVNSLRKIEDRCFDLLPVIQSHLYVGNLPKKPVLRDEEKEVIAEVCQSSTADDMIVAILNKLKAGKMDLSGNYTQALCRVYTGICRQRRDVEKARVLAYSLLIEDFPDSAKLILFIVTTWPTLLTHTSSLSQAIHAITKLRASEELLSCLLAFLGWNKTPPCDIDELISRTLSEIRSGSNLSFTKHSRYGEDLGTNAWEHVYALRLLCTNKKWKWTYDNLLGKELWPLMNSWLTQPRRQQQPISDVAVATVLRLIGCLGQLGLKEKCISTVVTIANVINTFGRHGPSEGVPWEVQLAAIYCIYDLSPCNPKQALEALAGWRGETSQSVPPAVTSCINQLASICRQANS